MNAGALKGKMSTVDGALCPIKPTGHVINVFRGSVNLELVDVARVR